MTRHAAAVLVLGLLLTACSGGTGGNNAGRPTHALVNASALDGMLLSAAEVNSVMGTTAMTLSETITDMGDHSYLLPNVNCLGIWQVGERTVYGDSGWTGIHGQVLRQPYSGDWDSIVVQAVVSYPSTEAAQKFYAASADRWSKCTNHKVNLSLNGQPLATWKFGRLTRTGTKLTMPLTRGGGDRSCQRVLSITNNVVIEVAACSTTIADQAATIVGKIESNIPH
jgi:PknH-like extracellular domain